jgi:protein-disulfide isomerase/uncharacterized membrane protein
MTIMSSDAFASSGSSSKNHSVPIELLVGRVISVIGIALSFYLLYHHIHANNDLLATNALCSWSSTFDCDSVARSPYSMFLGLPVASYGLIYYAIMCGMFFALSRATARAQLAAISFAFSIVALPPVCILFLISQIKLKKICLFCLSLYLLTFLLLGISSRYKALGDSKLQALKDGLKLLFSSVFNGFNGKSFAPNHLLFLCLSILGTVGAVIAPLKFLSPLSTEEKLLQSAVNSFELEEARDIPVNTTGSGRDYMRGPEDAQIEIIGFSDFECPHCHFTAQLIEQLAKEFRFRFVFKNFPLDQKCNRMIPQEFHLYACDAAQTARCAGEENEEGFWKAHDYFMSSEKLTEGVLHAFSSPEKFSECEGRSDVLQKIKDDIELGISLGIEGTPAIYVNKKQVRFVPGVRMDLLLRRILASLK